MARSGFAAEFYTLLVAPGVISVSHVAHSRCAVAADVEADDVSVEVDIVALGGLAWLEVKAYQGTLTMDEWSRSGGAGARNLRQQVRFAQHELLGAALLLCARLLCAGLLLCAVLLVLDFFCALYFFGAYRSYNERI